MSTDIRKMTKAGVHFYPQTHIDALVSNDGFGIDDVPVVGSDKLVRSGGVNKLLSDIIGASNSVSFSTSNYNIKADGTFGTSTAYDHAAIPVLEGEVYYIISTADICRAAFTTSNEVESGGDIPLVSGTEVMLMPSIGSVYKFVIPANCEYLMFNAGSNYNNPKCYKHYDSLNGATNEYTDSTPTKESGNLVTSKGIYDKIAERTENGNVAYSALTNEYAKISDVWQPKMLKTDIIAEGDTITDSNYVDTETGRHLIIDVSKYNSDLIAFNGVKYKLQGSASYHLFVLLDEDFKVVYISNSVTTSGGTDGYSSATFSAYTYKYIVFNNIFGSQKNPDVQVLIKDKVSVKAIEQDFTDAQKNQVNKNLGLNSAENVKATESYKGYVIDIETGEFIISTSSRYYVRKYSIDNSHDYVASGRKTSASNRCSIAYYNSDGEYIGHDKDGGGSAENFVDYTLTIPNNAAFVAVSGASGNGVLPSLKEVLYFKDINFEALSDGSFADKLKGKTIAIIGASMDTHGNTGLDKNAVEITIEEEDVGVELSAYVTYFDVQAGLTLGGTTFTTEDIGTEVTFTPTAEDIGKVIGLPNNFNLPTMKVWWQYVKEYFECDVIPVCWSGSGYTRNRQGGSDGNKFYTSHAWHDAQIRKCGIRTPGTMERTAPDVIILSRVGNDFSHSPYGRITEGYFDTVDWQYPDSDIREDGKYGILEAVSLTIKKLRETYPFTPIVMCDNIPMKRVNHDHFPMNNGYNSQPQLNKAMKEAADFFGCQFIPRSKCAITWENMYPAYVREDNVHPIEAGHEVIGKFVVDYLKLMNFTV